jgi:tryptophan-rich sensory protein
MPTHQQVMPPQGFPILKNLALALLLVAVENLLIFSGVGFSSSGTTGGDVMAPIPGWIIGLVWTALFAGLGVARGLMQADGSAGARRAAWAVLILLIACAAYPFYTIGLHNKVIGLFGNIITIYFAIWAAVQIGRVRRLGAIAPLAVIGWVSFATVALIDEGHLLSVS